MVNQKGKKRRVRSDQEPVSHQEHEKMAIAAIKMGADGFVRINTHKIQAASRQECAYRSYKTGMVDLLTIVRKALGFWGAEQVRHELERWNEAMLQDHEGSTTSTPPHAQEMALQSARHSCDRGGYEAAEAKKARGGRVWSNDPMFA